jgi:hypothetical protein
MKIELELEEARELMAAIVERLITQAGLTDADRAVLRKWRSDATPGSDAMRELAAKVNADLARAMENKKRSAVIKADWR